MIQRQKERARLPIGMFDSGVGGISVLREAVRILPAEDFLFFGDSANAPYGTKTREEILTLTLRHAAHLYEIGIKALVVACNTATSAAIGTLREVYEPDLPVIGIEPAIKPASMVAEHPRVLVLATPMTVGGNKFHELAHRFEARAELVPVACPGLMEYVERGMAYSDEVEQYLKDLLEPYVFEPVDAVVLGCTHYPFVKGKIQKIVGGKVPILDGGSGTARELKRRLDTAGLLRDEDAPGRVTFEMSLPERTALAEKLFYEGNL